MDSEIIYATRFMDRLRGLRALSRDFKGRLVLIPCHDVHTFSMSDPIDIAFVNKQGIVMASYRDVQPRRRYSVKDACCVIERYACPDVGWYEEHECIMSEITHLTEGE